MHLWGHAFHLRGCALVSFKFCIVIGILIAFRKILVFSSLFENFSSANKFILGFSRRAYLLIRHKVAGIDRCHLIQVVRVIKGALLYREHLFSDWR